MLLKQFEKLIGMLGLGVDRVQRTLNNLPWRVRVMRHPFPIKRFVVPAVVDAGKNLVLTMPGDHLQEDTAAIALKIVAVKLDKGVFARGKAGDGGHAGHGLKMDAAHLALG